MNTIVTRGKCLLGFIKRQAKDFDCPHVTKSLYCSLVRPVLEYCSIVWDPIFEIDCNRIESIQKQFLIFALRHLGWSEQFHLPPYDARLMLLGLESLSDRRKAAACCFVVAQLVGNLDVPDLADAFRLREPSRVTRSSSSANHLQLAPIARSRYIENAPLHRCIRTYNSYADVLSESSFVNAAKRALKVTLTAVSQQRL